MDYLILKWVHIISAILLFGTGLGSAFYKLFTDLTNNVSAMRVTNRLVVWADWLFTTPSIIIQPVTGILMLNIIGQDITSFWVIVSFGLYFLAGICWLPVVVLQIRMKKITDELIDDMTMPENYWHMLRIWFWLGIPAFSAMIMIVGFMVFKPMGW